jgi:hypothetical protein
MTTRAFWKAEGLPVLFGGDFWKAERMPMIFCNLKRALT